MGIKRQTLIIGGMVVAVALVAGFSIGGFAGGTARADPGLTMGIDADQDGTSGDGASVAVGSSQSVDARVDQLNGLQYVAYQLRVRYDDSRLDLTLPHDPTANNSWPGAGGGALICADVEPTEDDTGTKDWLGGCAEVAVTSPSSYTGVLHTLEFTCEAAGAASIQLIYGTGDDTFLMDEYAAWHAPDTVVNDTIGCTQPVGGMAEPSLLEPHGAVDGGGSSAASAIALAGAGVGGALVLAAGGWYARRRWVR